MAGGEREVVEGRQLSERHREPEDKTDDEIVAAFPPFRDHPTVEVLIRGGLPPASQIQLAALREKLAAEKK